MTPQQVRKIVENQIGQAIDAAKRSILASQAPGDEIDAIMQTLKKECSEILIGHILYPLK